MSILKMDYKKDKIVAVAKSREKYNFYLLKTLGVPESMTNIAGLGEI